MDENWLLGHLQTRQESYQLEITRNSWWLSEIKDSSGKKGESGVFGEEYFPRGSRERTFRLDWIDLLSNYTSTHLLVSPSRPLSPPKVEDAWKIINYNTSLSPTKFSFQNNKLGTISPELSSRFELHKTNQRPRISHKHNSGWTVQHSKSHTLTSPDISVTGNKNIIGSKPHLIPQALRQAYYKIWKLVYLMVNFGGIFWCRVGGGG